MELTSHQKVAQVLLSLSPKDIAKVMEPLTEDELLFVGEAIIKHAKHMGKKSKETEDVMEADGEFSKAATKDGKSFILLAVDDFSEVEVVRALYRIAFGEHRAEDLLQKLFRKNLVNQLSFLGNYSSQHVFLSLEKESVSVISLVLGTLKPKISADIIRLFDAEKRKAIIKAIAIQQQPNKFVIQSIETVLRAKLNELVQVDSNKETVNGEQNLFLILDKLDPESQDSILNSLEDKKLKERLEYRLFTWSSLELFSTKEIEEIFDEFNNEELASLILIDGIDARGVMETLLSERRMQLIEDEYCLMKQDLGLQSTAMKNATFIKKRFFNKIKEHSHLLEKV